MRDGDVADGLNLKDERFDGRKEDDGELEHGIGTFSSVKFTKTQIMAIFS